VCEVNDYYWKREDQWLLMCNVILILMCENIIIIVVMKKWRLIWLLLLVVWIMMTNTMDRSPLCDISEEMTMTEDQANVLLNDHWMTIIIIIIMILQWRILWKLLVMKRRYWWPIISKLLLLCDINYYCEVLLLWPNWTSMRKWPMIEEWPNDNIGNGQYYYLSLMKYYYYWNIIQKWQ